MKNVVYTDGMGRKTLVSVPDDANFADYYMGIPIGPPPLDDLNLPPDVQTRLHNELFAREIYGVTDIKKRRTDVYGALMAALKVDTETIMKLYHDQT